MQGGAFIVVVVLIQLVRSFALQGVRRLSVRKQSVSVDISPRIAGAIGSGFLAGAAATYGLIQKGNKSTPMPEQKSDYFPETANTSVEEKCETEMSSEEYWNRPGPWDEKNLGSLIDANKKWASRMTTNNPNFFSDHKIGHAPKILWIGCSDARVPANEIIDQSPGSVFVHRNIANQVVNTDFNCMSVLQYAVDVLHVKHIIVCGHYDCGGVKASLQNADHRAPLENWLRNIRDTYRLHKHELDAIKSPEARQRKLVELNVEEQCINVFKTAVVQKRRVETHLQAKTGADPHVTFSEPQVHAMVYEPTTGEATVLDVDFKKYIDDLHDVYDLYTVPQAELPKKGGPSGKVSVKTSEGKKVDVQSMIGESLD
jgi:carbonic anhydrase